MARHVLFLLGMHAGGTLLPAGCLAPAGAVIGEPAQASAAEAPDYAGPTLMGELSDVILARLGVTWDTPTALPERWSSAAALMPLARRADAVVGREFGSADTAVVADPRVCRIFPVWRDAFERAGFVPSVALVVERPHGVVNALARRHQFAPEKALALWYYHLLEAERATRDLRRTLFTVDQWHADAAAVLKRIARDASFPFAATPAARAAAVASHASAEPARLAAGKRPTAALQSGLDIALEAGYDALSALPAGTDPRAAIDALAAKARPALNAAIPPWIDLTLQQDRAALARLDTELAERSQELLAQRAELDDLRTQLPTDSALLTRQIDTLREESARERDSLLDQLTRARAEMVTLTTAMAEAPRATETLRSELAQAHRDLFDERASISRLIDEMDTTRRDAEGNAQRFESTRHHLEALASELAQTREALQSREQDYAIVADEIDALRVQLADLNAEGEAAMRARDAAQRQHARTTAERDSARQALEVANAERAAAELGVRQSGEALQVLRDDLPRRALAESQLAREREAAQLTLRTVIDKLAAVDALLSERNAYIAELVQRHNSLAQRLNSLDHNPLVRAASWIARMPTGRR